MTLNGKPGPAPKPAPRTAPTPDEVLDDFDKYEQLARTSKYANERGGRVSVKKTKTRFD